MSKNGFIIYKDLYDPIKDMSLEDKGIFLDAIFEYQISGKIPSKLPAVIDMAFKFFKSHFDRDQQRYEAKCLKNKENANKRWNANASKRKQTNATDADKDIDKDKEKDIDINNKRKGVHLFKHSPYYDKNFYLDAIKESKFDTNEDVDFGAYWYSMEDWSAEGGNMKKDWLAVARSWIRRDIREDKLKTKKKDPSNIYKQCR